MDQTNTPPDKPGNAPAGSPGGAPGGGSSTMSDHSGANTFSVETSIDGEEYKSTTGKENALLLTGGNITLNDITILKTGDDDGEDSDFYGYNAAIFAMGDTDVKITNSKIETNGAHANAVFSYGNALIDIADSTITTSANNSGGIMVTGGGSISASNLNISTAGNSSAAIRSDRGGGTIYVKGGTYKTTGVGSPAIYSTANITAEDANLISTASEGVVIEGKNFITLKNTELTATNNTLNGNSETYKTIFIYQSMSGDASEGTGTFTAEDSTITTNQGDHFFITNTTAVINLSGNNFIQNDESGAFLRAQSGAWGNSGSNGGNVTLNTTSQEIFGDIVIDGVSSLVANLQYSYLKGSFSGSGKISLTLSEDSIIVLTSDSNISSLENADESNSNIYANGHKLIVNGQEVSINQSEAPESFLSSKTTETTSTPVVTGSSDSGFPVWGIIAIVGGVVVLGAVLATIIIKNRKKSAPETSQIYQAPEMPQAPTDQGQNDPTSFQP